MLLKAAWSSLEEGLDTNVATTIIIIIINKEKGINLQASLWKSDSRKWRSRRLELMPETLTAQPCLQLYF